MTSVLGWVGLAVLLAKSSGFCASSYPTPVPAGLEGSYSPYYYSGAVKWDWMVASGSVAVHPRVVISCAHVNYDETEGGWLPQGSLRWIWGWNLGRKPQDSDGVALDGYFYLPGYAEMARRFGQGDPRAFAMDFVVNYSSSRDLAGGLAGPWIEDGTKFLQAKGRQKMIVGYPSSRYAENHPDEYRMHETGPFSGAFRVQKGSYLLQNWIETGGGNSGGGVWGWEGGQWSLAGVLVSGLEWAEHGWSSSGVYALNSSAWPRVVAALGRTGGNPAQLSRTFAIAGVPVPVPDKKSVGRTVVVSGMLGVIHTLKISLNVTHQRRGDVMVTLRSPANKTVTVAVATQSDKPTGPDLILTDRVLGAFKGTRANGTWTVTVWDCYRRNTGVWQGGKLEFETR